MFIDTIMNALKGKPDALEPVVAETSRWQSAIERARSGAGVWVKNEHMHPSTNVADRVYRKADGTYGVFYGHDGATFERAVEWFFPDAEGGDGERGRLGLDTPPVALTDAHAAKLEAAIRAEGFDIEADTITGDIRLVRRPT